MDNATRARAAAIEVTLSISATLQKLFDINLVPQPHKLDEYAATIQRVCFPAPPQIEGRMSDDRLNHLQKHHLPYDARNTLEVFAEARRARLSETELAVQCDEALARVAELEGILASCGMLAMGFEAETQEKDAAWLMVQEYIIESKTRIADLEARLAAANSPVQDMYPMTGSAVDLTDGGERDAKRPTLVDMFPQIGAIIKQER